jgi:hypothetical protein
MITFETPELQNNEALKGFEKPDDLGKAYVALQGRVSSGAIDLLPEDVRKDPTIANYKTLSDLAKGHVETKKLVGTIRRPPETADGYKFSPVEGIPSTWNVEALDKEFKDFAFKSGMDTETAAKARANYYGMRLQAMQKAEADKNARIQANETALKQEWGADYDKNMNSIVKMLSSADPEMAAEIAPLIAKNAPKAIRGFAKIANLLSEDSLRSLGLNPNAGTSSDAQFVAECDEALRTNNPKHPYSNERDPKHMDYVNKYTEAFAKVKGGGK